MSTGKPFRRMAAAAAVAAGVATIVGCGSNQGPSTFNGQGEDAANSGEAGPPVFTSDATPGVPPEAGGNTGQSDAASESGSDGAGDAPMAVAFYGLGNPLDGGSG
jgi:hypothetical protein